MWEIFVPVAIRAVQENVTIVKQLCEKSCTLKRSLSAVSATFSIKKHRVKNILLYIIYTLLCLIKLNSHKAKSLHCLHSLREEVLIK